jgi:hypothetical protein
MRAHGKREAFNAEPISEDQYEPGTLRLAATVLNGKLTDPTNRAMLDDELQAFEGHDVVIMPVDRWIPER